MPKQHKAILLYRYLLYLYPKTHRNAYGDQMVQTLEDMLLDQSTLYEKFTLWLRVYSELPFNIVEEHNNNKGGISVKKLTKISNRNLLYGFVAVCVVGSYVAIGALWFHSSHALTKQSDMVSSELSTLAQQQATANRGDYRAVTIVPSEKAVYMPLAKLKMPDTTLGENLMYTFQDTTNIGDTTLLSKLSVSTHDLVVNNFSTTGQFSCTEVVYADFGSPSYAVNTMWKSNGTVTLADERRMNIYYANSIPGCDKTWRLNNISPQAIADYVKQAVSY